MVTTIERNPFGGPIRITVGIAVNVFDKHGIDLFKLFQEGSDVPQKLTNILHMDDGKLLLLFKDLYPKVAGKEVSAEMIDNFTTEDRDGIRNAIWDGVENFTSAHLRHLVKEIRHQIQKGLMEANLGDSSSDSQPEPDSTPGTTP